MEPSVRAPDGGHALLRLLARIDGSPGASFSTHSLADRLTQWVDWRAAVSLSTALETGPCSAAGDALPAHGDDGERERLRAAFVDTLAQDRAFLASRLDATLPDAAFFRQRYVLLQQRMAADVGLLRRRLRTHLARLPGAAARLAAVDAAMEQALAARERALLGRLPDAMAAHYDRARAASAGAANGPWLDAVRRDLRALLLAELDFRLQPVDGLLAALASAGPRIHAP